MNHIYNIVWNQATACYQVVTEIARGPSKSNKKSTVAALGAVLGITSLPAFAGPTGGQVTAGSATIAQSGTATTINQTSAKAAIDWTQFSVGANESVRFNQPNASAITLNRVTGAEPSSIMGSISANGQVFILNPNGVLFGAGAQVNVGSLTASTLRLDNANFMAGNYKFAGNGSGSVINNGTIAIAPGGTLAFMAPVVQNTGTLSAPSGSVLLAAAQGVTLTLQADGGLVAYTLDAGSAQALVDNGGLIEVGSGHVVLTAKGIDAMSKAVVNHSGLIEAQTVGSKNGVIELLGDMQSGTVNVSGKLDASAPNADGKGGDGGFIETSAATVQVAETAQITTAAVAGKAGNWLIDPLDITINSGVASAISNSLASGNVTISTFSAEATGNGDIFVNSAVNWSANKFTLNAGRNININANLDASGTAKLILEYGQATTTGAGSDYVLGTGARVNLPAGQNFSTLQGSAGVVKNYTVITDLGAAGSTTGTDLQGMNGNLAGNYVMGADIDAAPTSGWNGGAGFNSIGKSAPHYTGTFSGLGHEVSNLYINRTDSLVGMFGAIYGEARNVGIINANITAAGAHAGILVGTNQGSVSHTYSTGTIKNIIGIGSTGGLIGSAGVPATMNNIYSSASVEANHAAGGLVGFHFGIIEDSYATGKVFNNTYAAGGLVGLSNGVVSSSYSTGEVVGTGSKGGLIGAAGRDRPATTTNSYWDTTTSKLAASAGGTGKTTAQMQQQATYAGWDFVNTWIVLPDNSYPTLRNNPLRVAVVTPDPAIEAARLAAIAAAAEADRLAAIETARVAELARQAAIAVEQARLAEIIRLAREAAKVEADRVANANANAAAGARTVAEQARLAEGLRATREAAQSATINSIDLVVDPEPSDSLSPKPLTWAELDARAKALEARKKADQAEFKTTFNNILKGPSFLIDKIAEKSDFLKGALEAKKVYDDVAANIKLFGPAPAFLMVELDALKGVIDATQKKLSDASQSYTDSILNEMLVGTDLKNLETFRNPNFIAGTVKKAFNPTIDGTRENTLHNLQKALAGVTNVLTIPEEASKLYNTGTSAIGAISKFRKGIEGALEIFIPDQSDAAQLMKEMQIMAADGMNAANPVATPWGNFEEVLVRVSENKVSEKFIMDTYSVGGSEKYNKIVANALIDLRTKSKEDKKSFLTNGMNLFTNLKASYEAFQKMEAMSASLQKLGLSTDFQLDAPDQTILLVQAGLIKRIEDTNKGIRYTDQTPGAEDLLRNQILIKPVADDNYLPFDKGYKMENGW